MFTSDKPIISALRVSLLYLGISIIWIAVTDNLILGFYSDPITITRLQTQKGWFFVFMSGTLIFFLMLNEIRRNWSSEQKIRIQNERLTALRLIDDAIASRKNYEALSRIFLEQVVSQLDVDAADLLLFEREDQSLEFTSGYGFKNSPKCSIDWGKSIAWQIVQDKKEHIETKFEHVFDLYPRSEHFREEGFVFYCGFPLITQGNVVGVLEVFNRAHVEPDNVWLEFFRLLAGQAAIAIEHIQLIESLNEANHTMLNAYETTLEGWANALELRDDEIKGHSQRVTEMTVALAMEMGFTEEQLVHVRRGALLHDIGKMGIPDSILHKPGPLTEEEWEEMRRHPVYAYNLLSKSEFLEPAMDIPHYHHERWDGSGYPEGLKGEDIPLAARIFAVVDAWDALRSPRPYRDAWPHQKVCRYLEEQAGKEFDTGVVGVFLELLNGRCKEETEELRNVYENSEN